MSKQAVLNTISTLPDDVSIEEIMYRLYILEKHEKAMGDIIAGNVYGSDEVRKTIIKN